MTVRNPSSAGSGGTAAWTAKVNTAATVAPTVNDDSGSGYATGSFWIIPNTGDVYFCRSASAGAAVWARMEASSFPGYIAGRYYGPKGMMPGSGSANGASTVGITPIYIRQRCTISELGARVTTLFAGGNFQLALYARRSDADPLPGALLGNTASMSTASVATLTAALAGGNLQLEEGLYWLAAQCDNGTSALSCVLSGISQAGDIIGDTTASNVLSSGGAFGGYAVINQTFGSWASTYATGVTLSVRIGLFCPMGIFKVASVP